MHAEKATADKPCLSVCVAVRWRLIAHWDKKRPQPRPCPIHVITGLFCHQCWHSPSPRVLARCTQASPAQAHNAMHAPALRGRTWERRVDDFTGNQAVLDSRLAPVRPCCPVCRLSVRQVRLSGVQQHALCSVTPLCTVFATLHTSVPSSILHSLPTFALSLIHSPFRLFIPSFHISIPNSTCPLLHSSPFSLRSCLPVKESTPDSPFFIFTSFCLLSSHSLHLLLQLKVARNESPPPCSLEAKGNHFPLLLNPSVFKLLTLFVLLWA